MHDRFREVIHLQDEVVYSWGDDFIKGKVLAFDIDFVCVVSDRGLRRWVAWFELAKVKS